jgi:hypothetical protein
MRSLGLLAMVEAAREDSSRARSLRASEQHLDSAPSGGKDERSGSADPAGRGSGQGRGGGPPGSRPDRFGRIGRV